jgi:hypothetical protein
MAIGDWLPMYRRRKHGVNFLGLALYWGSLKGYR